ncbi:hypothetical protein GGQ73_003056 [Rhizobium skierniewicense]|uniref:ASCH domain-containing protein n=1 Tax=Rhizobium skierniewicense TaxID=984260 RepID=A0A7W6G2R3_9HYPH|nr:hypothetical protein [Rhizobium skierniewicense]MBB3947092.1 hypothetical protein [Rhizobium skierniewicense]
MVERAILFNGTMVAALLAGRKTQTRRALKPPYGTLELTSNGWKPIHTKVHVNDRLYVCETHFRYGHWEPKGTAKTKGGKQKWHFVEDSAVVVFDAPAEFRKGMSNADPYTPAWHKRPGRFMFRKHSRLTLKITDVRIERLQDISETDAVAEGCFKGKASGRVFNSATAMHLGGDEWSNARDWYADLWERINGLNSWDANPWVVAYTFVTINANIDQVAA